MVARPFLRPRQWLVGSLLLALLGGPLALSPRPAHAAPPAEAGDAPVPVLAADPVWGDAAAPVTVVAFTDFECPFCSRAEGTMEELRKRYGEKRLRIVTKHNPLPFHRHARLAHEVGAAVLEVAGQRAFARYQSKVFANQRDLEAANLWSWAAEVGVSAPRLKAALDGGGPARKVSEDLALGQHVGVQGTPAFFVNGVLVSGAQPLERFVEVIDAELAEAKKLTTSGVAPRDVYARRTKQNFSAPTPAAKASAPAPDTAVWRVPVESDDPVRGPADALVTLVAFSDFQCPFCARVEPTLTKLAAAYPNELRIVWKDHPLPFHERARPAAWLGRAAFEKGKSPLFWKVHGELFVAQQLGLADEVLADIAQRHGLDWDKVRANNSAYQLKLASSEDLADDVKARGTPHFFINGRRLSGAQPYEDFQKLVDEQLELARAQVKAGTPAAKLYDKLMKDGKQDELELATPPALTKDTPIRGPRNAPVTVHVFSDFQCPFCQRVNGTLEELDKAFPGKLRFAFHHMPLAFHQHAALAAEAAQEAFAQGGSALFFRYHDKLFANQGQLGRSDLEQYAKELDLDLVRFRLALDKRTHKAKVDADKAVAEKAGVNGTPHFLVGKYVVSGAQPLGKFQRVVRRVLAGNTR